MTVVALAFASCPSAVRNGGIQTNGFVLGGWNAPLLCKKWMCVSRIGLVLKVSEQCGHGWRATMLAAVYERMLTKVVGSRRSCSACGAPSEGYLICGYVEDEDKKTAEQVGCDVTAKYARRDT